MRASPNFFKNAVERIYIREVPREPGTRERGTRAPGIRGPGMRGPGGGHAGRRGRVTKLKRNNIL